MSFFKPITFVEPMVASAAKEYKVIKVRDGNPNVGYNQEQCGSHDACNSGCISSERYENGYADKSASSSKSNKFAASHSCGSNIAKSDENKGVPASTYLRGGKLEVDSDSLNEPTTKVVTLNQKPTFLSVSTVPELRQIGYVQDNIVVIGSRDAPDYGKKSVYVFNKDGELLHKVDFDTRFLDMIATKGRFAFFRWGDPDVRQTQLVMVDTESGESVSDPEYGDLMGYGANNSDHTFLFGAQNSEPNGRWSSLFEVEPQTNPLGFRIKENDLEHLNEGIMRPYRGGWRLRGVYPLSSSDDFFVVGFGRRDDGTVDIVPMTLDKDGRMVKGHRIPMEDFDRFREVRFFQEISSTKFRVFGNEFAFEVDLEEGTGRVPREMYKNLSDMLNEFEEEILRRDPNASPHDYEWYIESNGFFLETEIGESGTVLTAFADTDAKLAWFKEQPDGIYLNGLKKDGFWRMHGQYGFGFSIKAVESVTVE